MSRTNVDLKSWIKRRYRKCLAGIWLGLGMPFLLYDLWCTLTAPTPVEFAAVRALLLALAAWVGLPLLVWRALTLDRQTRISRETHYTEQFRNSVKLLGATMPSEEGVLTPVIESRIGAIYALERLAKHSQYDYGAIIETLCAYVREHCGSASKFELNQQFSVEERRSFEENDAKLEDWCNALRGWIRTIKENSPANRADVTVALAVLSRISRGRHWQQNEQPEITPNLSGANLQGAMLSKITEGLVHEDTGISLAHLEGAVFSGSNLENSSLIKPIIPDEISSAPAGQVCLQGATLIRFYLRQVSLLPILDGADLTYADLSGARIHDARFRGAKLRLAHFIDAKAKEAKFGFANLKDAMFDLADLQRAEFIGSILEDCSFKGANLENAILRRASLHRANLEGALLISSDFRGAKGLTISMIAKAFGDGNTKLPEGIVRPKDWTDNLSAFEKWQRYRKESS